MLIVRLVTRTGATIDRSCNRITYVCKRRDQRGFLKKNRPRNTIAQELSDGRYQQRVVKSKKIYDRKKLSKILPGHSERDLSDV
jgi:hypothetical protein